MTSTTNKYLQTSLKPYSLDFDHLYNISEYVNYQEYLDLKDLKNASIKELSIDYSSLTFDSKSRQDLIELLRNPNIKKIILEFVIVPSIDFLLFISKYMRKNTTIKEIELDTRFSTTFSINAFLNNAWFYFINAIRKRLVKFKYFNFDYFHSKFDDLLLNNNLKEIEIFHGFNENNYPDIIKKVLSSEKYLDDFSIKDMEAFTNHFYDSLSIAKTKAEIDTLHIKFTNTDYCLATIENAYLFKIKTIRISIISGLEVFKTIFKLSNNPHNTVKRIIFDQSDKNLDEIILKLKSLDLKDYNIKKLPKIYLHGYQELIIDGINIEHSYSQIRVNDRFCLILKKNSIEMNNLTELLYILFNSPKLLRELTVEYEENDMKLKSTYPQYIAENRRSIILGMISLYDKFKVNKIQSNRKRIEEIRFEFKKNSELNFIYFTVLEIMVLMEIEIKELCFNHCPISDLVEFLEKHKSLDSLNIENIKILNCATIDKENIEKLYHYSHLIGKKIYIRFSTDIDMYKESVQIGLKDIFHSRSRNYNNLVDLSQKVYPFMIEALNINNINNLSDYMLKIKTLKNQLKSYEDIYFSKHIRRLDINFDRYDLESLSNQFLFYKEYMYDLRFVYFMDGENNKVHLRLIMFFMTFETICNSKYKRCEVNHFQYNIKCAKFSKKCKRYLKIHNIVLDE